jgi:hypothetical protein
MRALARAAPDALAAALVALAVYLAFGGHAFLNYDTFYALAWGDGLMRGERPELDVPVAPTPHPLALVVGALASPLGPLAEDVLLALVLLGLGALCVGLFRLGQALYVWPVGLLAALLVATRHPILNFGIRGYVDLPALALVVWAAVLEARRPRRGAPVLVPLTLAGLLRPEVWLYAAAYWLWATWGRPWPARARLALLAAAAPALWALTDLAITGNPLWSLTGTSQLAAALERPTGLAALPGVVPFRLGEILRLPELLLAVAGFAAGLAWFRRRTLLPVALAALNGVAFTAFAVAGLPLLGRYLFLAATMLALLAAVAALGWTALPPEHPARARWRAAGTLGLVVLAVFAPVQAERLEVLRGDIAARDRIQADLGALARAPRAARVLERCTPLFVPNHRPVPSLAFWLDRPPGEILSAGLRRPTPEGTFVAPASERVRRLSILDPRDPRRLDARVPADYAPVARNPSWLLYAGCGAHAPPRSGGTSCAPHGCSTRATRGPGPSTARASAPGMPPP